MNNSLISRHKGRTDFCGAFHTQTNLTPSGVLLEASKAVFQSNTNREISVCL